MNERECETCIKRKSIYCPNSDKCFNTSDKPYYQNRIMLLEETQQLKGSLQTYEILLKANVEENQQLKQQLQQRDNIINKAKKFVYDYKKQWTLNDDVLDDMNELLEILNIDKGDD